jgi:cell division transport system ATP-binding protein
MKKKNDIIKPRGGPMPEGPLVDVQNVSKIYGERGQIKALEDIKIKIDRGEFACLVGPSGAGKSTLVRLLIREEFPTKGKIFVAGRNISHLKAHELPFFRRKVGVVFQDYKLLPQKTVWENVAYALEVCDALPTEIRTRVPKILSLVGLSERPSNYPDQLSGGERQRVAIARAMVHMPKILLADEPTGNLDPQTTREIIDLLLKINQQGTLVLLATHNQEVVNRLNKRVISLKDGKIIADKLKGKFII